MDMRGLSKVISEIRKASAASKEDEQRVIEKELHKVRQKFKEAKHMKGYDRKKNVCKLLYIYMLGYEVDFGQMEGVQLLTSDRYSEKHIGYLACTLFLNENNELLTLITHSIKQDLNGGRNPSGPITLEKEFAQCLALTALANVGGKDFADSMADDVRRVALARETPSVVKKKALLTLLRLYRSSPEKVDPEEVASTIIDELNKTNSSVTSSALSLVLGFLGRSCDAFSGAVPKVIKLLYKLILSKETSHEYMYYTVPAPWVQVKCFRVLQHFPMPTEGSLKNQITSVLNKIISTSERVLRENTHQKARGTPARNNAMNAVLAEAITLVMHWDQDRLLLSMSTGILGRFITDNKDTNLRYLGLDLLAKLTFCQEAQDISKHQATIVSALRDPDISIRRKSLDLLYVMCDGTNASEIVGEMLDYLSTAEYVIKEDLVVKIAILCEKYATDFTWYVDVIMSIISQAGDFVGPDVWQRVVHIVTNNVTIQKHAVQTVFSAVQPLNAHEVAIKVATHLIGEFSSSLSEPAMVQFTTLHSKWGLVGNNTKALLLSCYAKLYTQYPDDAALREKIKKLFEENGTHMDVEIQQRAIEYANLAKQDIVAETVLQKVFENMPAFEVETSRAHQSVIKKGGDTTDSNVWQQKQEEKEKEARDERKKELDAKNASSAAWRDEAERSVFTQDTKYILTAMLRSKAASGAPGWKDVDVNQDWDALISSAAVPASEEAAKLDPPMHYECVLAQIAEQGIASWKSSIQAQINEPLGNSALSLGGSAQHIIEGAMCDVESEAQVRFTELVQLFPSRGVEKKKKSAAAGLDDIFGADAAPAVQSDPMAQFAPVAQSAPPAPATASLDDIFGGAPVAVTQPPVVQQQPMAAAATPMQSAPPAIGGGGGLEDIFGGPPAPTPAAPVQAMMPPVSTPVQIAPWSDPAAEQKMTQTNLPALLTAAQGVLYEDAKLQIGLRSEYHGHEGRVLLFFGNKTQALITNISLSLASVPANLTATPGPFFDTIDIGAQKEFYLSFACQNFFIGQPVLNVGMRFDNSALEMKLQAPLPVVPTKFMEELKLPGGPQFFQAWQATPTTKNPPEGKIYRSARDVSIESCENMLTTVLKMKVLKAVDNNPNNMVGAAYFTPAGWTAAPANLPKKDYVVLVNIETNPGAKAARVTVKTPDQQVETAVQQIIQRFFEVGF
eukprot:TRINITY_DN7346_c0_g1_i1.p1 TRINITY_DN7346_c0_g1~~TRINITY_DN7346_c0_g1_i1.p1  ORF type:complete len:1186 (+),score=349.71 TRINITY_DN7346_c0_g1_i1:80-3637(+)